MESIIKQTTSAELERKRTTKTLLAGAQLYTRFTGMDRYFVQINHTTSGYGGNLLWWYIQRT